MFFIIVLSLFFCFSSSLALNHIKVINHEVVAQEITREYHYNYDTTQRLIQDGSFSTLCTIAQRQILCSLYCNQRIAYNTDSICDEYPLPKNNNWGLFKPYVIYRDLLNDAYKCGNRLILLVEKYLEEIDFTIKNNQHHFDAINGLPTIYSHELAAHELHLQLKKAEECIEKVYNIILQKHEKIYPTLNDEQRAVYESSKFLDHMFDQQAVIKTWFIRFESYQNIIEITPEITNIARLQNYYHLCQEKLDYLKKTSEQFEYIRNDVSSFPSETMLKWDFILSNAYKSLEALLAERQSFQLSHPSTIQMQEDFTTAQIKKFWNNAIFELAYFYNDIGYYSSEQTNPLVPTIEDVRQALCKIDSCLRNLLSYNFFSKKVMTSLQQQLAIAKVIGSYPRVSLHYSSIIMQETVPQETPRNSFEIKIINPRMYSAASSTQLASPGSPFSSYESDNESYPDTDESLFTTIYETAMGEMSFEEVQKEYEAQEKQPKIALLSPT